MGAFVSKNRFNVDGRVVIITGGSQGMGRGLAKLLAQKGASIVIVARNQQKLDDALRYISSAAKNPSTQRFLAISADVTRADENARILAETTAWNGGVPPDIVWANAGYSHPALFPDTSLEVLRSQMDINYFAAAYLAHATLNLWLQPARQSQPGNVHPSQPPSPRHFIMTSSTACFVGVAGYAPYSPPKAALRSLADTLRSELHLYNGARKHDPSNGAPAEIQVHCVCPGTITSPGYENENKSKHAVTKIMEEGDPVQSEDEVAAAAVHGLERGGFLITTQLLGHAMRALALGGSARNNWLVDTLFGWVTAVAWLIIGADLDSKVFKYGVKHGAEAYGR